MPRLFLTRGRGSEEEEESSSLCGALCMHEQQQQQYAREASKSSSGAAAAAAEYAPSACFNQDASCIAVAARHEFCIYSADPLGLTFRRELQADVLDLTSAADGENTAAAGAAGSEWELRMVEMLYTCNLLALVGRKRQQCSSRGDGGDGASEQQHEEAVQQTAAAATAAASRDSPSYQQQQHHDVCALWDDRQAKVVVQVQFRIPIRGVQLLKEVLLIILEEKICVYRLHDLCLLDAVCTCFNPTAICAAVSQQGNRSSCASPGGGAGAAGTAAAAAQDVSPTKVLLACPAVQSGQVQLLTYVEEGRPSREGGGVSGSKGVLSVRAHDNPIAYVCLSADGHLLGTASTRGTLLRIFNAATGDLLLQFRRGSMPAQISCLAFSPCRAFFACCSSTGTAHIYKLQQQQQEEETVTLQREKNDEVEQEAEAQDDTADVKTVATQAAQRKQDSSSKRSSSSGGFHGMLGGFVSQVPTERSFAQFKLPSSAGTAICAFGKQPHTLLLITAEKLYFKLKFEEGGQSPVTVVARDRILLP